MNIALPAVTIILGLLPGIVFFQSYFSGRFSKEAAAISAVSELALYVLFAVPLDAIALAISSWSGSQLDFDLIAGVVLGNDPTGHLRSLLAQNLANSWALTTTTYLVVLLGAFVVGVFLRKLVWMLRLDVELPLLRMKHQWYYVLQGRLPSLPRNVVTIVDVMIEHPGAAQLYRGVVSSFEVDRNGSVGQLMLRESYRRSSQSTPEHTIWKQIPGDRFIVSGSAIRSINLTYLVPEPESVKRARRRDRLIANANRLWRRFWLEEP